MQRWSVSRTYPCPLVGWSVSWSHFRISNLWSLMVAQIKKFKNQSPFIFEFCFWEDPPHPVNWSPTHLTGTQKLFFTEISVSVAQIKRKSIYFLILLLGGPSPPGQLVPNPFNWSPNTFFTIQTLNRAVSQFLCIALQRDRRMHKSVDHKKEQLYQFVNYTGDKEVLGRF